MCCCFRVMCWESVCKVRSPAFTLKVETAKVVHHCFAACAAEVAVDFEQQLRLPAQQRVSASLSLANSLLSINAMPAEPSTASKALTPQQGRLNVQQ